MDLDMTDTEWEQDEGSPTCDTCNEPYDEAAGDGYCGLCPECADKLEELA